MNVHETGDAEWQIPDPGTVMLGLTGAAVPVAAAIATVLELGSANGAVLFVTLSIALVVGNLAFVCIPENPIAPGVALCGAVIGAVLPAVLVTPWVLSDATLENAAGALLTVAGFGAAGLTGAALA